MIFTQPLPFINEFVEQLDQGIRECAPHHPLSTAQRYWLSFCLMGILLAKQVCWAALARVGLRGYSQAALSWMFQHSKLLWPLLFQASLLLVLKKYGITEGVLVGDDSDRQRAKVTKRIFKAHKIFDKKTGGWFNGQTVVLLYRVTAKVSLPVGFAFYQPDPAVAAWKKTDEALKKQGVKKAARPAKPAPNPACPSKLDILINLLREFAFYHPTVRVKAVLADAFYGSAGWMNRVMAQWPRTQVISQLQKTQKVRFRQRTLTVAQYFATHPGVAHTLHIRGGEAVTVILGSARLYVGAHEQKRFVVARKYPGEEDYRYLVASDLSWRAVDIAAAYTLRWLVEIVFTQMTKAGVLAGGAGGDDIADLDLVVGDHDPIDQQFDERAFLLERGVSQAGPDALAKRGDRGNQPGQFGLVIALGVELLGLGGQRLTFPLQLLAPALVLGQRDHGGQIGLGQPLDLALEVDLAAA